MNWEMLTAIGQLAAVIVGIPSLIYLALQIRAQTKERPPVGGKRSHRSVGRSHQIVSRQRRVLRRLSSRRAVVQQPGWRLQTQVQLIPQSLLQKFPGNVLLTSRWCPQRILVGRG